MKIEAKIGDVFLIPLDEESWAGGQIVNAQYGELYLAIFDSRFETDHPDPLSVIAGKPIFLTLSLDAKLYHGHWPILANIQNNLTNFPDPVFKVGHIGVMHIESRDSSFSRLATAAEIESLQYRTVLSPAVIEEAVKAYFGIGEWFPAYDDLLAKHAYTSAELLKNEIGTVH